MFDWCCWYLAPSVAFATPSLECERMELCFVYFGGFGGLADVLEGF